MNTIDNVNREYWLNRAKGYAEVNKEELEGIQHDTWKTFLTEAIDAAFPDKARAQISILDIGAGPGFISIILAEAGYQVTALDFAETMIEEARTNAGPLASKITFVKADAQNLPFASASFDVVFSRNLTWNLPDPEAAYRSWLYVLKKGGLMLVFDANWYAYLFDKKKKAAYDNDRINVKTMGLGDYNIGQNFDLMEDIARHLTLTNKKRPDWDLKYLKTINAGEVIAIEDIGSSLYSQKELINYASTPLFMVKVLKG